LTRTTFRVSIALLAVVLAVTSLSLRASVAAPGAERATFHRAAQNVDWLSAGDASRLDLDFTVLVPSWIPAPFGGTPAIQGGGGYYSLYWMVSGGPPTFLQVTGEVGGSLPAGSPADLNNQLSINASVQGYDAIHDVTSIYDNVWWVAGGVLYTVSSNNMTGTDSLSLANSLIALEQPAAPDPVDEPTPPPVDDDPEPEPGPTGSIDNASSIASGEVASLDVYPSAVGTLRATDGYFVDSGARFITDLTGGEVAWQAPSVDTETTVEFTLLDAQTGVVTDWSSITVYPTGGTGGTGGDDDGGDTSGGETTVETGTAGSADGSGGGTSRSDAQVEAVQTPESGGTNGAQLSDGTAGPELPRGSDGTGGIRQVTIP
jgi:hypothetical protein